MIFTAMTRAKGWLRVSGLGDDARRFQNEIVEAKKYLPSLHFTYPAEAELIRIKRDLAQVSVEEVDDALGRLADEMSDEELENLLLRRLKEVRTRKRAKKIQGQ